MSLKLISLNIEGHRHLDTIIPFLNSQKPDLVCLQEVFKLDLPKLTRHLFPHLIFAPTWSISQKKSFSIGNEKMGNAILSTLAFTHSQIHHYCGSPDFIPPYTSPDGASLRNLIVVKVFHQSQSFTIANTHFNWAMPEKADQIQAPHLKKLINLLKNYPQLILAGDFNAPRGQKTFNQLASLYQDNIPPQIISTIDPKLHQAAPLDLVVDGLFTTPHFKVKNIKLQPGLSDHLGIIAQIEKIKD